VLCEGVINMEDPADEKRKAARALWIIYGCMALGIALPFLLYFVFR